MLIYNAFVIWDTSHYRKGDSRSFPVINNVSDQNITSSIEKRSNFNVLLKSDQAMLSSDNSTKINLDKKYIS